MSLFNNYKTYGTRYNLTESAPEVGSVIDYTAPKETFDYLGNITAFSWRQGDKFTLQELPYYYILVPCDSRVYEKEDGAPINKSYGACGQMAYNTINWKCWQCHGEDEEGFIWEECPLQIFNNGDMSIALHIPNYKTIYTILDFRYETLYEYDVTDKLSIDIDINNQPLLVQGNYYLQEKLVFPNTQQEKIIKLIPITIKAGSQNTQEGSIESEQT